MNSGIRRGRTAWLFLPALLLLAWALCPRGDSALAQARRSAVPGDRQGRIEGNLLPGSDSDSSSSSDSDSSSSSSSDSSSSSSDDDIPAPLAWEIEGNDNTNDDNFLGTRAGSNFDLVLRTDGLERMRILKGNGTFPGDLSDLDGVIQLFTNLHLESELFG